MTTNDQQPTATAGAIANDHKRESMIAIDDLSRSIYALDKLAVESELARAALVVLEKQVEILHAKVTAAVSRQRDQRKPDTLCHYCKTAMTYRGTIGLDESGRHVELWYCPKCDFAYEGHVQPGLEHEPDLEF